MFWLFEGGPAQRRTISQLGKFQNVFLPNTPRDNSQSNNMLSRLYQIFDFVTAPRVGAPRLECKFFQNFEFMDSTLLCARSMALF